MKSRDLWCFIVNEDLSNYRHQEAFLMVFSFYINISTDIYREYLADFVCDISF